jgi:tRNA-dihydrouridine synthase B
MVFTEFVSSDALVRKTRRSLEKLTFDEEERPIGIQIYGHLPESMVRAAKMAESLNPDVIDLNFGCPQKKIAGRGAGAGMLRNIDLMEKITREVVHAVSLPVTVKTRLGWDSHSKNIVEVTERLQDTGIRAITIHARTRDQFYKGTADWTLIGEIKNHPRIHIPVIGNGDVDSPAGAKEMFDRYQVDGIMIGRAAMLRPWIFKEASSFLSTGVMPAPFSLEQKRELCLQQLELSIHHKGTPRGILEMRRYFISYFREYSGFPQIRPALVRSLDKKEITSLLYSLMPA